jgi:hypothetical protein
MVSITGTDEPPGTTCAGENEAIAFVGSPLTLRLTTPVKGVVCGDTANLYVALEPAVTVCVEPPEVVRVKSGIAPTDAVVARDVLGEKSVSPL